MSPFVDFFVLLLALRVMTVDGQPWWVGWVVSAMLVLAFGGIKLGAEGEGG